MQDAFGAKAETILADGGETGITAVEIFRCRVRDAAADPLLQRRSDADVFSGNAQRHAISSLFLAACETASASVGRGEGRRKPLARSSAKLVRSQGVAKGKSSG